MTTYPPHLPPPACSIKQHRAVERLLVIGVAAFFGLVAGLAGSAMLIGWGSNWLLGTNQTSDTKLLAAPRDRLTDASRVDWDRQLVTIYSKISDSGGIQYMADRDKIGQAVVLTAEGWLVLQYPHSSRGASDWQVLSGSGHTYSVQNVVADQRSGLLFLKIAVPVAAGSERSDTLTRAATFADMPLQGDVVYVQSGGEWQPAVVESLPRGVFGLPHLDSAPSQAVLLSRTFPNGSVVVSTEGKLIGLVAHDGLVLPSSAIIKLWPSVVKVQQAIYPTLGVEGWFDEEQPVLINGVRHAGFVVSSVVNPHSVLRRGDVVTEIHGEAVTGDLWQAALENTVVPIKVLRGDATLDLTASVLQL